MTELPQHRVHIRADDGTRAAITLSAEDRNALPKWDFDKAHNG